MMNFETLVQNQTFPTSALFIVATPIGNLADISLRALHVLQLVDCVAAEDTRHTQQLLSCYGLRQTLLALHQHNENTAAQRIVSLLHAGQRVAYVADAGTPGLSDPGAKLVEAVREARFPVVPIPGASALTCAISIAPTWAQPFTFLGFLQSKAKQRLQTLESWRAHPFALALYEAPHRLLETLHALNEVFGATRHVFIGRELTKIHETFFVGNLADAPIWFEQDAKRLKGEFVIVVEGAGLQIDETIEQHDALLRLLLKEVPLKTAVYLAQQLTKAKKGLLYERALWLQVQEDQA